MAQQENVLGAKADDRPRVRSWNPRSRRRTDSCPLPLDHHTRVVTHPYPLDIQIRLNILKMQQLVTDISVNKLLTHNMHLIL